MASAEEVVDELLATCDCDACQRYRAWVAHQIVAYIAIVTLYLGASR